jgi:hypothetical protein
MYQLCFFLNTKRGGHELGKKLTAFGGTFYEPVASHLAETE